MSRRDAVLNRIISICLRYHSAVPNARMLKSTNERQPRMDSHDAALPATPRHLFRPKNEAFKKPTTIQGRKEPMATHAVTRNSSFAWPSLPLPLPLPSRIICDKNGGKMEACQKPPQCGGVGAMATPNPIPFFHLLASPSPSYATAGAYIFSAKIDALQTHQNSGIRAMAIHHYKIFFIAWPHPPLSLPARPLSPLPSRLRPAPRSALRRPCSPAPRASI